MSSFRWASASFSFASAYMADSFLPPSLYLPWKGIRMTHITVTVRKRYTFGRFLLDLFLTVITHGLWLLWLLFKYVRTH